MQIETTATEAWLTKADAARALGVSERTIDALISSRRLGTRKQAMPGRRAATMIDRGDVERIAAEQNRGSITAGSSAGEPLVSNGATSNGVTSNGVPLDGTLAVRLANLSHIFAAPAPPAPPAPKPFMTLTDASEHTSLPLPLLKRLIKQGRLPSASFDHVAYVRTSDLEKIEFGLVKAGREDLANGSETFGKASR